MSESELVAAAAVVVVDVDVVADVPRNQQKKLSHAFDTFQQLRRSNFKLGLRNFGKIETDKTPKLTSRLNTTGVTLDASNGVTL